MGDNNGKPTRVNDPIQRALMAVAITLATWALSQVQDHSKMLSAVSTQVKHLEDSVTLVERRNEHITDDLHKDIREIRNILERKQ